MKKKAVSLLIAICLVLAAVPMEGFAVTEEGMGQTPWQKFVTVTFCAGDGITVKDINGTGREKLELFACEGGGQLYWDFDLTQAVDELKIDAGEAEKKYGKPHLTWKYYDAGTKRTFTPEEINKQSFGKGVKGVNVEIDELYYENRTEDENGNQSIEKYNREGKPLEITNYLGHTRKAEYTDKGSIRKEITAMGYETLYEYENVLKNGKVVGERLVKKTYADDTTEKYKYDEKGRLTEHKNADGTTELYEYDSEDNLICTTTLDKNGKKTISRVEKNVTREKRSNEDGGVRVEERETEEDTVSGLSTVTVSIYTMNDYPHPTESQYDEARENNLLVQKITDPQGETVTYRYHKSCLSEVKTEEKKEGKEYRDTAYTYMRHGGQSYVETETHRYYRGEELVKEDEVKYSYEFKEDEDGSTYLYQKSQTDHGGIIVKYEYDRNGNLISYTDGNGKKTWYVYDSKNHLLQTESPSGAKTSYTYDAAGQLITIEDAAGNLTELAYDPDGRMTRESILDSETGLWLVSRQYGYDSKGRRINTYDKDAGLIAEYGYDDAGNVISYKDGKGNETKYSYDAFGNLLREEDAEGNVQSYEYNEKGEKVSYTNGVGHTAHFQYDENGNLIYAKDFEENVTTFAYDKNNRQISATVKLENYEEAVTRFEYDIYGNIIKVINADDSEIINTYDHRGNVTYTKDAEGREVHKEYDKNGNLLSESDASGTTTYTYDDDGNLTGTTDKLKNKTKYEYDALGNIAAVITEKDGEEIRIKYTYDEAGRVLTEENPLAEEESNEHKTAYEYSSLGKVVKKTFEDAESYTTYTYDRAGNVTEETYCGKGKSHTTKYEYNKNNQVIREINPNGNEKKYTYTKSGVVEQETDALSGVIRYEYDKNDNVTAVTDALGNKTAYTYDSRNNVASMTDANNNVYQYKYDLMGNLTEVINPDKSKEKYTYDHNGNVLTYEDGEKKVTTYTYDLMGNLLTSEDATGKVSRAEYDALGRKTAEINPEGAKTEYIYDNLGLVTEVRDADGGRISYTYDAKGRVTKEERKVNDTDKVTKTYTYDALDNVISETDENNVTRSYEYDGLGNVTKYTDGLSSTVTSQYDFAGNCMSITDSKGRTHSYIYDKLERVMQEVDAKGNVTFYEYDAMGNMIKETRGGVSTEYAYDKNGNETKKTDAKGNVSEITYDSMNRPVLLTNGDQKTGYEYDKRGLVKKETDAAGKTKTYEYDDAGRLISTTDQNEKKKTYSYTDAGFTDTIEYANGDKVKYIYDNSGALIGMKDKTGKTSIQVDLLDRVKSVTDAKGRTVKYEYDNNGNKKAVTYPDLRKVKYTYDAENRITEITDAQGGTVTYAYDSNGNVREKTYPNGEKTTYVYDELNQLTLMCEYAQGDVLVSSISLAYDKRGNRTQTVKSSYEKGSEKASSVEKETYTYDELDNLTSSSNSEEQVLYEYDDFGNLTEEIKKNAENNRVEEEITYTYDNLNRLVEKQTSKGTTAYTYDHNGNRIQEEGSEGTFTYTYDGENRIIEGKNADGEKSEYVYNGLGMRVETSTSRGIFEGTVTKEYVTDYTSPENDDLTVYTEDGRDTMTVENIYAGSERLIRTAKGDVEKEEEILYVHEDFMGSTSSLTAADGNLFARVEYDAWGNPVISDSAAYELEEDVIQDRWQDVISFTGHTYDNTLGLYFAEARFYDAQDKIFMSQDPVKDGSNWYRYCGNNPVTYWDPTGLMWADLIIASGCFGNHDWQEVGADYDWLANNPEMEDEFLVGAGFMVLTFALAAVVPVAAMAVIGAGLGALESGIDYCIEQKAAGGEVDSKQLVKAMLKGGLEGLITGGVGIAVLKGAEVARIVKPLESCATTGEKVSAQLKVRWKGESAYRSQSQGGRALQDVKRWSVSTTGNYLGGMSTDYVDNLIDGKSMKESLHETLSHSGMIFANAVFMSMANTVIEKITTPKCFTAGTLVLTEEGNVAIEDIEAGDMVYAFDEETGETAYKEVVRLFENTTDTLTYVTVETEAGNMETIESTPEHPYYVESEDGFVEAEELEEGMLLTLSDGSKATVTEVITEELEEEITVYNFEVEDFHTYYVGENRVLVHNVCGNGEVEIGPDDEFVPANSIEEAEEFAKRRFTEGGNGTVSYRINWKNGDSTPIDLNLANEFNEVLFEVYKGYNLPKAKQINFYGYRIRDGKSELSIGYDSAGGYYLPGIVGAPDSLNFNASLFSRQPKYMKSMKLVNNGPYNSYMQPVTVKSVSDRGGWSANVYHEIGHLLDQKSFNEKMHSLAWDTCEQIQSDYALRNSEEAFAEGFASYMMGEGIIDWKLKIYFMSKSRSWYGRMISSLT